MRFFSVLALFFLKVPDHEKSTESISWESVVAGVRFVRKTKLILAAITLDLFAVLLGGCAYLLPVFVKDILHVDKSFAGYLRSSEAVGAVCMAVLLTHLPPMKRAGRTMLLAVAGFGVATIVFGVSHWCWLSLTAMFFLGALDNISIVVRHTLVQMLTPDVMRGRVSAVNNIFIVSSNEIGGVESAVTAWLFGSAVASVIFGGIGTIVVVLCAVVAWPQLLALGSLQNIRPAEEETEEFSRDP
jgi:MFS family permease